MKITKTLIITTFICSLFLVGCNKTEKVVDVQSGTAVGTRNITEEEKIAEMIKLIEKEEARMIESGEL